MEQLEVLDKSYQVLSLLGRGKGGYSYLVTDPEEPQSRYVLKQIHHEPCSYYTFGNKLQSETEAYRVLSSIGVPMPELFAVDEERERLLKRYIEGEIVASLAGRDAVPQEYFTQMEALCGRLYASGLNIDYFPTNFVAHDGLLYYVDYECNPYMPEWDFQHWGRKYWAKTIETERLLLRRFIPEDLDDLCGFVSDPEVVRFEPYPPMTLEEAQASLQWRVSTQEMLAIERKDTHRVIGNVYLGKRDDEAVELGYLLRRDHWRQGYAREACEAAVRDAFASGAHRVYAQCDPDNEPSWRLLEALRFRREALLRQNVFFERREDGSPIWKDTLVYARLQGEAD